MEFPIKDLHITEGYVLPGVKEFWVPRNQVESCDVEPLLKILKMALKGEERVKEVRGKMELITDGYDDDPRHLSNIPEVRTYYGELDSAFPFWFWFLSKQGAALKVIFQSALTLVPKPEKIDFQGNAFLMDREEVMAFMVRHYNALDEMTERFSILEDHRREVGREVEDYFMGLYAQFSREDGKRLYSVPRLFADLRYLADDDDLQLHVN
jgi:hypothetical protein